MSQPIETLIEISPELLQRTDIGSERKLHITMVLGCAAQSTLYPQLARYMNAYKDGLSVEDAIIHAFEGSEAAV